MKILINILTHGDELIGLKVADRIKREYPELYGNGFDILIANEEAYKKGLRFVDEDLNRCFPGTPTGNTENVRAYEISSLLKQYEIVIDIHSTKSETRDTVIITNLTPTILETIGVVSPAHVFLMKVNPDGALISHAKNGLAFEFGNDTSDEVFEKNIKAIGAVFGKFLLNKSMAGLELNTQYYEVFRQIEKPQGARLLPYVKNFSLVSANTPFATNSDGKELSLDEDFYPVIFGQDNYETIFGFAARKIRI